MAVFYWVGGHTGYTGAESGYNAAGNYWTNWVTGLTSTVGDLFYSPYAWNVKENWRLEHTGWQQQYGHVIFRDSVPTRIPSGNDSVVIGGSPGWLGTGGGGTSSPYYITNIAPHNFSLLFGGMSGDGITSAGLTAWSSGTGGIQFEPCKVTVLEKFTKLNKTWGNVASSWATTNGLTGLQIRTGEMGTYGLSYLWGDSRLGLSDAQLGKALALADSPLRLRAGNGDYQIVCYVNLKESNLSATGGAKIHIKSVNNTCDILMVHRRGYADPFNWPNPSGSTAAYGNDDTPASNHYLIPKGTWRRVSQGCGNVNLEGNVEIQDTFRIGLGNLYTPHGTVGYVVSDKTANVNKFEVRPKYVYGKDGNEGIKIECYQDGPVPSIYAGSWKNQSPTNCLTIGSFGGTNRTVNYLETFNHNAEGVLNAGENPRVAYSPSQEWRYSLPWAIVNWFGGPIVMVRNVEFNEITHWDGVILPDENSGLSDYFIIHNGFSSFAGNIVCKVFSNPQWKNFLMGHLPSDKGIRMLNGNGHYYQSLPYLNPNILLPYEGMAIKVITESASV